MVVVLAVAAATLFLVLLAWATSSPPASTGLAAVDPAATGSALSSTASGSTAPIPASGAPVDRAAGSDPAIAPKPATTPTPAPFIQNFGPPAGTPLAPVPSPTAPVPFPVGDGCDHGYGEPNQCVPVQFPPGVTDGCGWLRAHGFEPLAVHGTDRLGLDPNDDGVACGPGDG